MCPHRKRAEGALPAHRRGDRRPDLVDDTTTIELGTVNVQENRNLGRRDEPASHDETAPPSPTWSQTNPDLGPASRAQHTQSSIDPLFPGDEDIGLRDSGEKADPGL